jgi:hypothetical protein
MSVDALYAYAVLPEGAPVPAGAPVILPGARHVLVPGGGCAALVSPVPRSAFQPGPGCRMGDAAWLAERARAHQGAIAAVAACGPVLPLAFGALFAGPSSLVAWLDARGPRLRAALAGALAGDLTIRLEEEARLLRPAVSALAEDPPLDSLRAEMARLRGMLADAAVARRIADRI